jgi:predicted LPLAT superfamily acyltransferase
VNNSTPWNGISKGSAAGHWIFFQLVGRFGLWPAYVLLAFVSLYYVFKETASAGAIRTFRTHLGKKTRLTDIYRHFFSFGATIIDKYAFLIGRQSLFSFESIREDLIVSALERKKGVILLGAHTGNWEIAGNLLSDRIKAEIHYVMVDAEKNDVRDVFRAAFEKRKIRILSAGSGGLELMIAVRNALMNNGIVCMLGDRHTGQNEASHSFLGEMAPFPVGPFAIGAATGAPIIPVFITKYGFRKYVFKAFTPILFEDATPQNRENSIRLGMDRYVTILEDVVRNNPYEWFNFYDFWETRRGT